MTNSRYIFYSLFGVGYHDFRLTTSKLLLIDKIGGKISTTLKVNFQGLQQE